jgi:hypothetical protein
MIGNIVTQSNEHIDVESDGVWMDQECSKNDWQSTCTQIE